MNAIERERLATERNLTVTDLRIASQWRSARAIERREERSLAGHCDLRRTVMNVIKQRTDFIVGLMDFNSNRTLRDRRQHFIDRHRGSNPVSQTQAIEPRTGKKSCLCDSLIEFAQPRIDIATKLHRQHVGPDALQLGGSPDRG